MVSSRNHELSSADVEDPSSREEDHLIRKSRLFDEASVDIYGWSLPLWWPLNQSSTILLLRSLFLFCAFLIFALALSSWRHGETARGELSSANEIHWTASRPSYRAVSSLAYLPWDALIEPYRIHEANITFIKLNHIAHNYAAVEEDLMTNNEHINVSWSINGGCIC